MLIAVLSDTHRYESYIKMAAKMCKDADVVLHLGDNVSDVEIIKKEIGKDVIFVKGNCDIERSAKVEQLIELENKKILMTHGHEYGVKSSLLNLNYRAKELGADIALYGHSHIASIEKHDGVWFVNPGSVSLPRGLRHTIAFIEIKDGVINSWLKDIMI
ncbi:MAG: metallophosphoesterase [Clostridium sp.]|uniref:metallophosphoesterase n=1 Tax=Clostridium sp. TaxID=1506 RepID=UPI002A8A201F|nr:metallophosphoesterase [Clostridium sp.]MDY5099639.1 metallophosphoesterase [Clostridium sp.]